jgi:hypothetical protein
MLSSAPDASMQKKQEKKVPMVIRPRTALSACFSCRKIAASSPYSPSLYRENPKIAREKQRRYTKSRRGALSAAACRVSS